LSINGIGELTWQRHSKPSNHLFSKEIAFGGLFCVYEDFSTKKEPWQVGPKTQMGFD